ncbi:MULTISPECIES: hypothetical protein [Pseudomonas]|jgi:hypothetical protein|uniref:hypothetical protein n=1 Tax=Pseudomonas TaxID=286 RepID=UPI0003581681|nr:MULTISPECIES: hypothetical protein [Pseudomonas]EPJ89942.1 hypothetical protein CFII64_02456 [Pseudomonas sp. CFII64]
MKRSEIQQHVFDAIGIILVDKSEIHENSSFKDLMLDEDDVNELFDQLQSDYGVEFPAIQRAKAINRPEDFTLTELTELIEDLANHRLQRSRRNREDTSKE